MSAGPASQEIVWHVDESADETAANLADQVALWLIEDLAIRERVSLAVSGGSTPLTFFRYLSQQDLPWRRVDVVLVDERWVPVTDQDSNEQMVRSHLLRRQATDARFFGLRGTAATLTDGERETNRALRDLAWPLTVAVLGMGNDGHAASWFPGAPDLSRALAPESSASFYACAQQPPQDPRGRITLTCPVILAAKHRALLLKGRQKQSVFEQALAYGADYAAMPVRALFSRPLHLYWSP